MKVFLPGANAIPTKSQLSNYQKILRSFVLTADATQLGIPRDFFVFPPHLLIYFQAVLYFPVAFIPVLRSVINCLTIQR